MEESLCNFKSSLEAEDMDDETKQMDDEMSKTNEMDEEMSEALEDAAPQHVRTDFIFCERS